MPNKEQSYELKQEHNDAVKNRQKGSKALRAWMVGGAIVFTLAGVGTAVVMSNMNKDSKDKSQEQSQQLSQDEIIEQNMARQAEEDKKTLADYAQKVESEEYINSLKLPTGLKGASFRESVTGGFNKWINAGADKKLLEAQLRAEPGSSEEGAFATIALQNRDAHATALFGEGWQDNKYLKGYASHLTDLNAKFLVSYYDSLDNENGVTYKAQMESTDQGDGDGELVPGRTQGGFSRINYIYTDNSADSGVSAGFPEKNETLITFDYINNSTVVTYANYLTNIR